LDLAKFFLSGDSLKLGRLFLGFALAITVQSVALDYSDMEAIFRSSQTPKAEKLVGTWVGRCVHQVDPLRLWPAFFQFRKLDNGGKGFDLYSQSHTWFNQQTEKYDQYTMKEFSTDPQVQRWLDQEQWTQVFYENGSLVNHFQFPNSTAVRATRLYKDGVGEHIVIAYSQGQKLSDFPASYCFFNVRLPNQREKE